MRGTYTSAVKKRINRFFFLVFLLFLFSFMFPKHIQCDFLLLNLYIYIFALAWVVSHFPIHKSHSVYVERGRNDIVFSSRHFVVFVSCCCYCGCSFCMSSRQSLLTLYIHIILLSIYIHYVCVYTCILSVETNPSINFINIPQFAQLLSIIIIIRFVLLLPLSLSLLFSPSVLFFIQPNIS